MTALFCLVATVDLGTLGYRLKLALRPNVRFHFTPTSASGFNQVEIWFGIFTRKSLYGATLSSTEELTKAIEAFVTPT